MRELPNITNRNELNTILKNGQITIIKAGATWCGPCKQIAPLVDELLEQMAENVKILHLDVDKAQNLSTFLRINAVPTFISYNGFEKMDILVGANEVAVRSFFKKILDYS
jgi:thiol-disulfide isomerase/thioredoxin